MTEIEKIEYAKYFIDKLANGINPLDGTDIPEGEVVNNVRLSRCFFFVSDILGQVIEKGKVSERKKAVKLPFAITPEQISKIELSDTPISATVLAKKINQAIDNENMERISYRHINGWLLNIGMLEYKDIGGGKMKRQPTGDGEAMGILLQFWGNARGKRVPVVFYSKTAQEFIVDNIEAVIATKVEKGREHSPESDSEE